MQPPPFYKLVSHYEADPACNHLRFGQWFVNKFMPNQADDALYNTRDKSVALDLIKGYYNLYQWEW
jgi:hypothetical protein